MEIKTISDLTKLKNVFYFISKTFYEDALKYNEHYFTMSERFLEMEEQLKNDNELLLYIEEKGEIIAALTSKKINKEKKKITLGIIAVKTEYRRNGLAKELIIEFEKRCKNKGIYHIDLGSRYRACPLYTSLGYKPSLMIQVFDFSTIDDIKKENIFGLEIEDEFQDITYGFIIFKVDRVINEYINHFEKNVKNCFTQYIFKKDI